VNLVEITQFTEQALRGALGSELIGDVSVSVEPSDDGSEWLDIMVTSPDERLPSARQSIDASRLLRHGLEARGETRFPNVLFTTAAEDA